MTTYRGSQLSLYLKRLIEDNQVALVDAVNSNTENVTLPRIDAVFYGDQRVLTGGAIICVEPSRKLRDFVNTGTGTENSFETSIIIYVDGDSGVEAIQLVGDLLTEAVEDLINQNGTPSSGGDNFGGLVTSALAGASTEHAYRIPSSQTVRANRIIVRSMSRTLVYEV